MGLFAWIKKKSTPIPFTVSATEPGFAADAKVVVKNPDGLAAIAGQRHTPPQFPVTIQNLRLAGKPALQVAGARYNNLTITITRMITIKRPIMMTSLVLGGLMKDRRLKFDCLHGIRSAVCTFQTLISVR